MGALTRRFEAKPVYRAAWRCSMIEPSRNDEEVRIMELSPQARLWARRIGKGSVIAVGIYAAVQIAFAAFIVAAFALGGEIG